MGNGQAIFNYKIVDYKHFKLVVTELGENKISFQTCCNYYKSLKHFIRFLNHHNLRLMTEDGDHIVKYLNIELTGIKDVGHYLSSMASDVRKDKKLLKVRGPTPYEICEVLRVAKKRCQQPPRTCRDQRTEQKSSMQDKYLSSIILLDLAYRPSSVEGLTHRLVEHCMAHNRSKTSAGNEAVSINSASHKTSESYTARFVLSGYSLDFFERYAKFVRPIIVQRNSFISKAFLLQVDGKHFDRISEAPGKLQAEYNLPHWMNNDARISYETYVQECLCF